jgi:hypothetical protein
MCAMNDRLGVVYSPHDCTPELRFQLLEISNYGEVTRTLISDNLVVTPSSKLEWFGFTNDTCDLVSYDSSGCLWLLGYDRGGMRWVPMLQDAAKLADCSWFWLAAVTSENAIGVCCLSNERCPAAKPRPALRTVPLVAPVLEPTSKGGKFTVVERLFRTRQKLARALSAQAAAQQAYDSDDDELAEAEDAALAVELETDKCLLNLMEDACHMEQNLRAFDYATRLKCSASFKFAGSIANHYKRTALASRVEELARRRLATQNTSCEDALRAKPPARLSPVTPAQMGKASQTGHNSISDSGEEEGSDGHGSRSQVECRQASNAASLSGEGAAARNVHIPPQAEDDRQVVKRPCVLSSNRFQKKLRK